MAVSCLTRAAIGGIGLGWLNDYQGKFQLIGSGLGMKKKDKRKEKMKENERRVDETQTYICHTHRLFAIFNNYIFHHMFPTVKIQLIIRIHVNLR